ncbi:MAG: GYD domain-containing protein, partial [Halobacteria archaeon]|nr:GYD domain-containing protein [Halobacteria archaeon]
MPTYITLIEYTKEGAQNMEDSPKRLDMAKEIVKSMGGEIKEFYLTFGEYDGVVVFEAPDDESAAKALLTVGGQGAVSTQTLKGFPED